MDNSINHRISFYQSANADDETIRENFLVRLQEYDIIIKDILKNPMKGAVQHYLLLGRRGSGKSTLLKRLQIEIATNSKLRTKYIPVNLAEEQANIYKLYDLLEEVIRELEHHGIKGSMPQWDDDTHSYTRNLLAYLQQLIIGSGKKIILLLDNIDRIFENIQDEANLLREYLLNHDDIRIIGGSTRMTEHFWKYSQPFYQFFRVLELQALTAAEVRKLLLSWSEKLKLPQLKSFVETRPGQLETIRLLTDGLPRTLQFFVNILLTNAQETGYEYLRQVMDSATPLYQERLNSLPPSQRKIVLQMAFLWEATGTGKLAESARINNNVVSAQLKQLVEKGIAEKIDSGNKNHLYRLTERFFNLWLIFTQGNPKEKRKAKCLTIFLENFYDAEQIQLLADEHLNALSNGSMSPNSAALLTKAFAQSKYIKSIVRDKLIEKTLKLGNISEEIKCQLPLTMDNTMKFINSLLENNDVNEALKIADNIEQDDGIREFVKGLIYLTVDKLTDAETAFLASVQRGFIAGKWGLANTYERSKNFVFAIKYYLEVLNFYGGNDLLHFRLGLVYLELDTYELAKDHFLMSIELNKSYTSHVAEAYFMKQRYEEGEFFIKKPIEEGIPGAASMLAYSYYTRNENKQEALELIRRDRQTDYGKSYQYRFVEMCINLWNGIFLGLYEKALDMMNNNIELSDSLLTSLLYHGQFNLVCQFFESSEIATSLRERFLPIYYASIILGRPQEKESLKMPPELISTVEFILVKIRAMKGFFDDNLSAATSRQPKDKSENTGSDKSA